VDQALDHALALPTPGPGPAAANQAETPTGTGEGGRKLLRALLDRTDHLTQLAVALKDVDTDNLQVHVDEDVDIAAGETVDGSLVAVGGHVRVAGTVNGDIIVVSGSLELLPGSEVEGDVRLADASIDRNEGDLSGTVVEVTSDHQDLEDQIREQVRSEMRNSGSAHDEGAFSLLDPVRAVLHGVGGLIQNLLTIFILGLIGAGVVAFAGTNMDAVAETARRSPGRSAMVGVAGTFLLLPVWVLGAVALAVSIIGIPVLIAWIPLFPLAAVAGAILGYIAVSRNIGEWLAHSELRFTDRMRASNPIHTIFGGLIALVGAFIAANVVSIVPFFGFLEGLLIFVGVLASVAAVLIGFGAVLLTRAGTRPEYYPADFGADAGWDAMDAAAAAAGSPDEAGNGEG
jgi:hypothetical protein